MNFDEGLLVETIQNFTCIWDTRNKDHRNLLVVENAWKSIASIMEDSVEGCREAWKSIRAKYIRERKSILSLPSGSGAYHGNWPLFKSLSFLAPVIQTRRTTGNVLKRKVSTETRPSSSLWDTLVMEDGSMLVAPEEAEEISQPFSQVKAETESSSLAYTPNRESDSHRYMKKRRVVDCNVEKLYETCADVGESISQLIKQTSEESNECLSAEDRHFALSLAEYISKISNVKIKLRLKSKILLMVADASEESGGAEDA